MSIDVCRLGWSFSADSPRRVACSCGAPVTSAECGSVVFAVRKRREILEPQRPSVAGYISRLYRSGTVRFGAGVAGCLLLAYILAGDSEPKELNMNLSKLAATQLKSVASGEVSDHNL